MGGVDRVTRLPSHNNIVSRLTCGEREIVLKLGPAGQRSASLRREPGLLRFLDRQPLPTPKLIADGSDGRWIGRPWFATRSVGRRTAAERRGISPSSYRVLLASLGDCLARLHDLHATPADGLPKAAPLRERYELELDYLRGRQLVEPVVLDFIGEGLSELPQGGSSLCHFDFNPSQCVRVGPQLSAIVDWEGSGLGDAATDFAIFDGWLDLLVDPSAGSAAEASRLAYRARRPLPDDYAERYRPVKLAHFAALVAAYARQQRHGPMRTARQYLLRAAGDGRDLKLAS